MNLPNWISIIRILFIPFFVTMILKYRQTELEYFRYYALGIFLLAVISDALDGGIARLTHKKTQLGSLLDPLADKLLLVTAVILLSISSYRLIQLPIWILVTFISRDVILLIGTIVIYMHSHKVEIKPNLLGKLTTFSQMLTVVCVLLLFPYTNIVWRIAGTLTIVSGVAYIYIGSKQLDIIT